jgi:hypothetical protein
MIFPQLGAAHRLLRIDTASIESNITSGVYDLTTMARGNLYSQGFPALDYLFFSPNAIGKYGVNTASRVRYTKDVVGRIKTLVDKVIADWAAYRAGFTTNTKTNVGSPIGNIVNQLAYQLDLHQGSASWLAFWQAVERHCICNQM